MNRLLALLIAIDQAANVLIGSGWPDETLSAHAYRARGWRYRLINALFFWQNDHCKQSYESEISRRQYPPHYWTEK